MTVSWADGRPVDRGALDPSAPVRLLAGAPESTRVLGGTVITPVSQERHPFHLR